MTWKKFLAKAAGDLLGVHVVRKGSGWAIFEEEILATFLSEFEIDCVFDVGANAGQYARKLRSLGYGGPIVSVEPIPQLAHELEIAAAADRSWFIENLALDETNGQTAFNIMVNSEFSSIKSPSNDDTALFANMNVIQKTIVVETMRLEDLYARYFSKLGFRRPFLKMDTQGNDLAVARGAGPCLLSFVGLESELAIKRIYNQQSDYREAIDFYESYGFTLSSLIPNNAGHFPDLVELDCIMYNHRFDRRASRALATPEPATKPLPSSPA